jgi:hypothetical protein
MTHWNGGRTFINSCKCAALYPIELRLERKLRDHISSCLTQAAEAKRQADATADASAKTDFLSLERLWNELAQSYQFSQRLERFLLNHCNIAERRWEPISRAPLDRDLSSPS